MIWIVSRRVNKHYGISLEIQPMTRCLYLNSRLQAEKPFVSNEDGTISYESRSKQDVPLELLNIAEKKRFMDGEKVRPGLPLAGHFSTFRLDYDAQSLL